MTDAEKAELEKKAAADKAAADKAAKRIKRQVAKGDTVHLVHSRRGHVEAKVTDVNKDGTIDLETAHSIDPLTLKPFKPVVITSSPLDPTRTLPDSWHPVEAEDEAAEAAAG